MKILLPAVAAAMLIGGAMTAAPAQAKCWSNGYTKQCSPSHYYHGNSWSNNAWRQHHQYTAWGHNGSNWGHSGGGYHSGPQSGWGYNR